MLLRRGGAGALQHQAVFSRQHGLVHPGSARQCSCHQPVCRSASTQTAVLVQQQDVPQPQHTTKTPLPQHAKPAAVFRFRHFTLLHGGPCAMKMGTDAMLLGAWAQPPKHTAAVLDVGTGSGVLALMMAQKTQQQSALVHALDIDSAAVTQAAANAAASPWGHRTSVHLSSLQNWAQRSTSTSNSNSHDAVGGSHDFLTCRPGSDAARSGSSSRTQTASCCYGHSYDVIISNPPYFLQSSKPDQAHRAAARHADVTLPYGELAGCAAQLLAPGGRLFVVLPVQEARVFAAEAAAGGLALTRLTEVYMKSTDKQPKRHLLQFEHAEATAPAAATILATAPVAPDSAAAASGAAAVSPPQVDSLIVLVPAHADAGNGSGSGNGSRSSSTSGNGGSTSSKRPAAPWVFSEQYKQLTVDFHHPDLLA